MLDKNKQTLTLFNYECFQLQSIRFIENSRNMNILHAIKRPLLVFFLVFSLTSFGSVVKHANIRQIENAALKNYLERVLELGNVQINTSLFSLSLGVFAIFLQVSSPSTKISSDLSTTPNYIQELYDVLGDLFVDNRKSTNSVKDGPFTVQAIVGHSNFLLP